ncbi:ABC transporter permease [Paenibacillus sp. LHD-117]|uniref:ABC transporter permease n=1 Tax=Paenibacillus sp. LHD-117 TaxID=3071412 RepID=UPI0027E1F7CC|nr:ABC transporter permease [Paenibacillus sp. LHD-117]MDQ6419070.1 ABC transporter permease [Paenibacillus sp. LHD-117]
MIGFAAKKTLRLALLLASVTFLTFLLVHLSPIDPVQAYIGADLLRVGPEQRAEIAAYWGLDQPFAERFLRWAGSLLQGDMGTSMIYREPVASIIAGRFASSAALMAAAWLLSGAIGFAAGAFAAIQRDRLIDRMIQTVCYTIASTPAFWIALLAMTVFAVWLGWFPVGLGVPAGLLAGDVTLLDRLHHMALPALTLSVAGIAPIALHTRAKLIEVYDSDYVLFARARGERGIRLFLRHGLRNAAMPALVLQFASFGELFGGAVLAEQVFAYPGLGQATVEAGLRGDVPLLMGLVICSTLFVFAGNLIADIIHRGIDPRLRFVQEVKA